MRVDAAQLSFAAEHRAASSTTSIVEDIPIFTRGASDSVQLSSAAGAFMASDREDLMDLDPMQRLAILTLEALLGRRIHLLRAGAAPGNTAAASAPAAQLRQRLDVHSESEQTTFQARGEAITSDGRSISFSVELNMQREFQSASFTSGVVSTTDPLIVNFGGGPAQLTGATIAFDLNNDGTAENIHFAAAGSGFLMLDRNGDGRATDGSELFGPQTGRGFAELAAYDSDGNGWIDEADPVFRQLRLWTADGLTTLADQGIGAISTASIETPFAMKDAANTTLGEVRSSGVYLSESGTAGTIQQVDLAQG